MKRSGTVEEIGNGPDMIAERLVSLAEAAQLLGGVSVKTVRRMIAAGLLPQVVKVMRCSKLSQAEVLGCIERLKSQRASNGAAR